MTATPIGIALLSCLRRLGSSSELLEISENYFTEAEEREALRWLREYVHQHHAFPGPIPFRVGTGITTVGTREPLSYYKDRARQRALYKEITNRWNGFKNSISDLKPEETIRLAKEIVALENRFQSASSEVPFGTILTQLAEDSFDATMTPGLRGVATGYEFLDDETDGWQNTDNIALVGRISDGKTNILLKHALAAHAAGHSVLIQSNEMGDLQIARRMLGMQTRINPRSIRTGTLSTYNRSRMLQTISAMQEGVPLHIYAGSLSASTPMLRVLCERHRPDIIFVDASYLLRPEKKGISRRENLVDVANDLKVISIDFRRPLLHTVQFNREAVRSQTQEREERRTPPSQDVLSQSAEALAPRNRNRRTDYDQVSHLGLHKIAETDAIAANASVVIGLARPRGRYYNTRRYYQILKGREGESGLWQIHYNFDIMNFSEVTREDDNQETAELTDHMQ